MQFAVLAAYLEKLERISSRNEMTALLAEVLKAAPPAEVAEICYLLLGELLPSYHGVEFNVAEKLMVRVLAAAYRRMPEEVGRRYKAKGDLGDVAAELAGTRVAKGALGVGAVYRRMLEVARDVGVGSQERKVAKLAELIAALDARAAKYVTRIPVGKLRLGFSEATLLDALSLMAVGDKSARPAIEQAYNVTADIGAIAERLKRRGLAGLRRVKPKPGLPIRPSLAERLGTVEEAVRKVGPLVGVEPKLDGFRTQIHIWGVGSKKQVALFSRNMENTTAMFPDIAAATRELRVKSAILDGEAIGYNPKTGTFAPFQETVQRKRKYEIEAFTKKIPLSVFVFDILYHDGESFLGFPFRERREVLERVLARAGAEGALRLADHWETDSPDVVREKLRESIAAGLEGLVVKNLVAPYEAGKRGFHWVKLKATSAALERLRGGGRPAGARLVDTVDCVVMGGYRGRGKRAAFGFGGFLLGVRGRDDRYYSISRLGTGLSDEQFREARRRIGKLKVAAQPKEYVVDEGLAPDVWAKPALVAEILADEITLSSRHTAGRKRGGLARRSLGEGGRGYSLRFPRLVRFRDDKNPEDATTVAEIAKMYRQQKKSG